ncbi:MAG: helicase-related protein [Candidatus Njordarchaeia archaeon]
MNPIINLINLIRNVIELQKRFNPFYYFVGVETNRPIYPYLHQVEILSRVLLRSPIRILIADEIGLGKTITALSILKRLYNLGLAERTLIIVPRILVKQWSNEIERMGLRNLLKKIESYTFSNLVREGFQEGIYLTSMDLIKRDEYLEIVEQIDWDVIIVDEAHRLGAKRSQKTQRYEAIGERLIGKHPLRNVLLLSATPHRGDPHDYLARIRALDPYLEAGSYLDTPFFYALTHNVLVFRRTKIDVNDIYEGRKIFPDCKLEAIVVSATSAEKSFHRRIVRFLRTKILDFYERTNLEPRALGLLIALIFKRASSSPYAAIKTMEKMIKKRSEILSRFEQDLILRLARDDSELEREANSLANTIFGFGYDDYAKLSATEQEITDPDELLNNFAEKCSTFLSERDLREIKDLISLAQAIKENDSRLLALINLVRYYMNEERKIVIFSEYEDTAKYIFENLAEIIGRDRIILVTGDEVSSGEAYSLFKKFELEKHCSVMIATDVASEGLNLQVASVVINYEPPWSPVKLEQRMGRVWRLGQKRDVIINNIFLGVDSDRDVLNVLYRKLIAMGRAIGTKKSPIGEEVVFIDFTKRPSFLLLNEIKKDGKKVKPTEYTFIREYIRGGKVALDSLVNYIIQAIQKLDENLKRFSVFPITRKEDIESIIKKVTGFQGINSFSESIVELAKNVIRIVSDMTNDIDYHENPNAHFAAIMPGGAMISIDSPWNAYKALSGVFRRFSNIDQSVPCIAVRDPEEYTLLIYELQISEELNNRETILYSEPIGVLIKENNITLVRGDALIRKLNENIRKVLFYADEFDIKKDPILELRIESILIGVGKDILRSSEKDLSKYRVSLIGRGWRGEDRWCPQETVCSPKVYVKGPIGVIKTVKSIHTEVKIQEETKRKIEEEAMQIALSFEIKNGRKPERVDNRESFDILSKDPKSNQVRYIEVKGHLGSTLLAELTESEYKVAKKLGDDYWLYIVLDIGKNAPKLFAISNPLKNMKIRQLTEMKYQKKYLLTI